MPKPLVLQRHLRNLAQQRGTTMIEVMVAALVLSAGLMGLAAMQTKAIKTANGLATQQAMVQALGAFSEARLAAPNHNIVNTDGSDNYGPDNRNDKFLAVYCNSLWSAIYADPSGGGQIQQPTSKDWFFITDFLTKYTSCGSAALTEYADYWNQYDAGGMDPYAGEMFSTHNGTECDYIVPRARIVSCTLPTGEPIRLQNLVWVR